MHPYYTKAEFASGFVVKASWFTDADKFQVLVNRVRSMFEDADPDMRTWLLETGLEFVMLGALEQVTDHPGFEDLPLGPGSGGAFVIHVDHPVMWISEPLIDCSGYGTGATDDDPMAFMLSNMLFYDWFQSDGSQYMDRIQLAFDEAVKIPAYAEYYTPILKEQGQDAYYFYFREGLTAWFDGNGFNEGINQTPLTREDLEAEDPMLAGIIEDLFGRPEARWQCSDVLR